MRPAVFARNVALVGLVAVVVAAPRPALQSTAPFVSPAGDVSRSERSASADGRIGAPTRPVPSHEAVHLVAPTARATASGGAPHPSRTPAPSGRQQRVARPTASASSHQARAGGFPTETPRRSAAPRPSPASARLAGTVSWYCLPGRSACTSGYRSSGAYAAAGPAIRAALGPGWRGRTVTVSTGRVDVSVTLIDWCSCPDGRLLDLYGSVYGQLAGLSSGLLDVRVEVP